MGANEGPSVRFRSGSYCVCVWPPPLNIPSCPQKCLRRHSKLCVCVCVCVCLCVCVYLYEYMCVCVCLCVCVVLSV